MSTRMLLRSRGSKDNPNVVSPPPPIGISKSIQPGRPLTPPKFWIEDPTVLLRNFAIIPNAQMTEAERFNAMTRLILIIALILFFIPVASWLVFLLCGVILLAVLYSATRTSKIENYRCEFRHKIPSHPQSQEKKRRKFSLRPR